MIERYRQKKAEEARNAAIAENTRKTEELAAAVDVDLSENAEGQLTPAERLNDIEIALCELLDAMA